MPFSDTFQVHFKNIFFNPFRTELPVRRQITWNDSEIYVPVRCTCKKGLRAASAPTDAPGTTQQPRVAVAAAAVAATVAFFNSFAPPPVLAWESAPRKRPLRDRFLFVDAPRSLRRIGGGVPATRPAYPNLGNLGLHDKATHMEEI